ncbi:MAG: leucine-rich repeat domain-containing protein [Bacillota bacterium]|nr:leucine-rich repeat domain-containing protein [Bacillota bacterium]
MKPNRHTLSFLICIFLLFSLSFTVDAEPIHRTFRYSDGGVTFKYTLKNGKAAIMDIEAIKNKSKVITFPERVLNPYSSNIGYPVTEVRYWAEEFTDFDTESGGGFYLDKVKVVLPEGYLTVGDGAFRGDKITDIQLPDSLEAINKFAFEGSAITELNIPANVSQIGDAAFANCKKLKKVTLSPDNGHYLLMDHFLVERDSMKALAYFGPGGKVQVPEGIQEIAPYALDNGKKITRLSLPASLEQLSPGFVHNSHIDTVLLAEDNRHFTLEDGVLLSADRGTLVFYPHARRGKSYATPDGVHTVVSRVFTGLRNLKELTLSPQVRVVDDRACEQPEGSSLRVSIQGQIESVGMFAFSRCTMDKVLTLPGSLRSMGYGAFYETKFQELILSEGIEEIAPYAFAWVKGLKKVSLPSTMKALPSRAFFACASLEEVQGLEHIQDLGNAFKSCDKLKLPPR